MKFKNWSDKINNFVERSLKTIKINDQQHSSLCIIMPAMPKEKTNAVSLRENNFTELKHKELPAKSAATSVMAASTAIVTTPTISTPNNRLQQQNRSICGCGAASVDVVDSSFSNKSCSVVNGHSSPVAVATTSLVLETSSSQKSAACCRAKQQNHFQVNPSTSDIVEVASTKTTKAHKLSVALPPPKKSPNDFIFGKFIGEGSFSNVYLAVDVQTKREYAIKVCEKRHILREHKQEYIRREREVMHILTNVSGFVNLSCTFQDNRYLYFVMTYAKNGDLLPYINKVGSFDVDCTRHYAAELVLACEQMHRRNVVHRDLKPENILLDENMHTLIADFGSAKILSPEEMASVTTSKDFSSATMHQAQSVSRNFEYDDDDGSDDVTSPSHSQQYCYERKRKGSFVGTAQYVSPEVLQNGPITPAADLWALGCIVYQMLSGLPPFRGSNDYVIFKEILACDLDFPKGFDKHAEDLVKQLLKIDPEERLGAQDKIGRYQSIRSHTFFDGVDFDTLRQHTPPTIYPYLPGVSKDEDFRSTYHVPDHLEPGLDDKQLTRLLGMELGTAFSSDKTNPDVIEIEQKTVTKNMYDISDKEKNQLLVKQKSDKWHLFADNEVIFKKGFVNKRKGLFARKRMLLLTTGPRLIYIDPVQMIKKGEIPWSHELRVEAKNFKIFFVHTPNRTYYLEDPEGYSLEWVNAIEKMRTFIYKDHAPSIGTQLFTTVATSALKTSST